MDPIFTATTRIEEKTYAQMILAKQQLFQKWMIAFVYILALPVVCSMTLQIENPYSAFGWTLRIFVLALTAAIIPPLWRRVRHSSCRSLARKLYRGMKVQPPAIVYRFYEDHIEVEDDGPGPTLTYAEILQPVETADYFLLFLSKSLCHAVAKDHLSGEAASFEAFLNARCGRPCAKVYF